MNMLTEKLLCFYQTIFAICLQGQIYVASSIRVTMFCDFCFLFSFVVFVCLIVSLFVGFFFGFVSLVVFVFVLVFVIQLLRFLCFFTHTNTHTLPPPLPPPPPHTHIIVDFRCSEYLCICYVIYFRHGDISIIFVL